MKPITYLMALTSLSMLLGAPTTHAQTFSSSTRSQTGHFNPKPVDGQSMAIVYSSTTQPANYIAAHVNLNFYAGKGTPHVDAYEIRTLQRSVYVYANNGQPYVHFIEKGACYPNRPDCRQSTIPETDFVPFKGTEFRGRIEAKIEETPQQHRFVIKMQDSHNVLVAVDMESMQVIDGIVEVDPAKPTPVQRRASWLPGVKCRPGLTCYERFHRAGMAQLTRGRIRWADGTVQHVDDRSMSHEPDSNALYKLGHQRVWHTAVETALPGFQAERRAWLAFAGSPATRSYSVATPDYLRAFETSVRSRTMRPQMAQYYGYAF